MVLLDARGGQYLKTPLLYINEGKEWVDLNGIYPTLRPSLFEFGRRAKSFRFTLD
jgi:hypothetical protein